MKLQFSRGSALSFILLFFLESSFQHVYAQQNQARIRLMNSSTSTPIVGAHYTHADQMGVSDEKGLIVFILTVDAPLKISHTTIGVFEIGIKELAQAINNGFLYLVPREIHLQPVTVIALRPAISSSRTVDIGSQEKLSHDAGALLMSDPSISGIRKGSSYGFDPVLRGFKYEQLNLTVDGVPVAIAACPNRMDPPSSQVSLNMVDKVEIIKGPHALRFGTPTGGTINFVSNTPLFSDTPKVTGRLSGANELNGDIYRTEAMLGFTNKILNWNVFGSLSDGSDYLDGSGSTVSSNFYRSSIGSTLSLKLSGHHQVGTMFAYNVARDVDFPSLAMDLRKDRTSLLKSEHTYENSDNTLAKWQTTVYYSNVDHLMDNLLKSITPRMTDATAPANTISVGARTEAQLIVGEQLVYIGSDYKREEASGKRIRTMLMGPMIGNVFIDNSWQDGSIDKFGIFAELHGDIGDIDYIVSVRIDNNRARIDDPSSKFESLYTIEEVSQFNPSFSLGLIKGLKSGWRLGTWLARSQRSASLSERFINYLSIGIDPYEMVGNPNLDAEVNQQLDLNLSRRVNNLHIDLGVFGSYLTNMISSEVRHDWSPSLSTSPGVRQFTNISEAVLAGGELRIGTVFPQKIHHEISGAFTYGQNVSASEPLAEIAPLDIRYTVGGNYEKMNIHPSISVRHVAKQSRISTAFGEKSSQPYTIVDLSISVKPMTFMSLDIGAQNLFDVAYYEHLSRTDRENARAIYSPGRNIYTRLSIVF